MGVQLELLGIPYVVLDRQPEPGGTWSINRYPDVRVDTISITYEFSFEKNYPWIGVLRARRRGAQVPRPRRRRSTAWHDNIRFNRNVKKATFDEDRNVWVLEVDSPDGVETIEANVLVNAVGTFTNPNYPQFEGEESFEGRDPAPVPLARRLRRHRQAHRGHRQRLDRRAAARADRRRRRAGLRLPAHPAVDQPA